MSDRTLQERVVDLRGFKYIKLKSGRHVGFWEMHTAAERAQTDLYRAISRAYKLASAATDDDYQLERLAWFVEELGWYAQAVTGAVEKQRTAKTKTKTKRERIARLRNTTGRTPAEAEAFLRKADELEADLA